MLTAPSGKPSPEMWGERDVSSLETLLLLSGSRWRAAHWPRCAVAALFTSIKPALLNSGIQNASPSSTPAISCRQAGREPRTDQLVVNSHIRMGTGLRFFSPPLKHNNAHKDEIKIQAKAVLAAAAAEPLLKSEVRKEKELRGSSQGKEPWFRCNKVPYMVSAPRRRAHTDI